MPTHNTNLTRRPIRPLRTKLAALLAALSVILMSGGLVLMTAPTATAEGSAHDKVFVCKYVTTPGEGERLQSGQNPISVSYNALPGMPTNVQIGDEFNDAQGRSIVIAYDDQVGGGQSNEPSISDCPAPQVPQDTSVTPSYPSATEPTCDTDGHLVVPAQPNGVVVSGGGADGAGPGTYEFTYSPADGFAFPEGTDTTRSVTVLAKTGNCPVNPTVIAPNAPSTTPATCTTAGSVVAPAAKAGVNVARTELGNGSVKFDSTPAAGFVFSGAQTVSSTVTAPAKLTGSQCAEVLGTDKGTQKPPATPRTPEVLGTSATRTPAVKGTQAPASAPTVAGVSASAPVPSAVEAGLAGQQTDVRVLVGQALLGGGLLLLVGAGWSGLGRRRSGIAPV